MNHTVRVEIPGKPGRFRREAVAAPSPQPAGHVHRPLPCVDLGDTLPGRPCGSTLRHCLRHGDVTTRVRACDGADRLCATCPDYATHREGRASIALPLPHRSFNGSLFRWGDRWLFASRRSERLWLHTLDERFGVLTTRQLRISHPAAKDGQEDPRLFEYAGRVWVSFTGLTNGVPSVLLAELGEDLAVARVLAPDYPGRAAREKNWAFFEAAEELHCVYSIEPHVVLRVDPDSGAAEEVARTSAGLQWSWGQLRGGAAPVWVGDRLYHWFHSTRSAPPYYTLGLYTFECRPLFRITSWVPEPLLHPVRVPEEKPVVFPCGAVLDGDRWLVSYGHNDRECRIVEFSREEIERRLVPVGGPE